MFRTIAAAFSMFSRIPVPQAEWNQKTMRYMLCAFPMVGVVIGGILIGWEALCAFLGINDILFAAGVTLLPVMVTGGIHLDGFCDTVDALSSHENPERRREILKDPHAGAFAVIGVASYLILYFALACALPRGLYAMLFLGLIQVLSRIVAGLSVTCFPASGSQGLFSSFKESAGKNRVAMILFAALVPVIFGLHLIFWQAAAAVIALTAGCAVYVYRISRKSFGGMSGDLSGYLLALIEITALAGLILVERLCAL